MSPISILFWLTLGGVLLTLYLALFTWYIWPALIRKSHCAWCWKVLHLMRWYPRRWSSTICERHDRQLRAQAAARRAGRLATATRPQAEAQA
jgi:membrane protein required for beta-lactamase induction